MFLSGIFGGVMIFEFVSNFCYGFMILMLFFNIVEFCCVFDYLQMMEDYGRVNLCECSEFYFMQVVLQSWDDILVVLQYCECLMFYFEQFGIECWCLDVLVFMVCMEFFDFVV